VANSTDLLHLRIFPSVEDTLPLTSRFFNTWKNSSLMNSSQHSGHLHWTGSIHDRLSEPTAVVNLLSDFTWTSFHPWKMLYHRLQGSSTSRKPVCHEGKSTFWPFILDQTTNRHFLSPLQWYMVLPDSNWPRFHLWKTLYHGQQRPFNTWKTSIAMNSSQYSHHFYWIKPSSAHFHCTFFYYWCILRFDIGLDGFSVTGF